MEKRGFILVLFLALTLCGFSSADSLLRIVSDSKHDSLKIDAYLLLSERASDTSYVAALDFVNEAIEVAKSSGDKKRLCHAYLDLAGLYEEISGYKSSIQSYQLALETAESIVYYEGITQCLIGLSSAYDYSGQYAASQEINFKLFDIYQSHGDSLGMADALSYIGIIYYYEEKYDLSLQYNLRSLDMYKSQGDKEGVAVCFNNIANVYSDREDYDRALDYYRQFLKVSKEIDDYDGEIVAHSNIGDVYSVLGQKPQAFDHLVQAIMIADQHKDNWAKISPLVALGNLMISDGKGEEAIPFLLEAIKICKKLESVGEQVGAYQALAQAYEQAGQLSTSIMYHKLVKELTDSLYNENSMEKLAELEAVYKVKETENQLKLKNSELEMKELSAKKQQILVSALVVGIGLLIALVFVFMKRNRDKQRSQEILMEKNAQIEEKNKDITDSITYAERIQKAVLPSPRVLSKIFNDSFLYFKPRDIVSGDFYWFDTINGVSVVAVVDCTGHGVPGAFMSMIGREYIDQIMNTDGMESTAEALKLLDEKVSNAMRGNEEVKAYDGMDLSILAYHHNTGQLQFSGAKNSLYIIRDGELIKLKGDSHSIGGHKMGEKEFTGHTFWTQSGDCLYMTSDGFPDQFGGPKGKKYKISQFVKLVTSMSNLSMAKQYEVLDESFHSWKGDNEQVDDVCVVGIKV